VIVAILDTNVLVSGFVRAQSVPGELLRRWRSGAFALVTSTSILREVERTFRTPYFRERLSDELIAADLTLLRTEAGIAPLTHAVSGVATHPEDDLVLAAAVSAEVDYLVTGDRQLLKLGTYQGVGIVSPRAFLDCLAD